jgi:hypothetical protein
MPPPYIATTLRSVWREFPNLDREHCDGLSSSWEFNWLWRLKQVFFLVFLSFFCLFWGAPANSPYMHHRAQFENYFLELHVQNVGKDLSPSGGSQN